MRMSSTRRNLTIQQVIDQIIGLLKKMGPGDLTVSKIE